MLKNFPAVFLYDYPASQAALAEIEGSIAKRFELYIDGTEVCNAFYELTDPKVNRFRIEDSNNKRRAIGKQIIQPDDNFFECLENGLPACSGNALGVDRLLALLIGDLNLDRVLPFRDTAPYGDHGQGSW